MISPFNSLKGDGIVFILVYLLLFLISQNVKKITELLRTTFYNSNVWFSVLDLLCVIVTGRRRKNLFVLNYDFRRENLPVKLQSRVSRFINSSLKCKKRTNFNLTQMCIVSVFGTAITLPICANIVFSPKIIFFLITMKKKRGITVFKFFINV